MTPSARPRARVALRARVTTAAVACAAAIGVLQFRPTPRAMAARPFVAVFSARPSDDAYGRSGEVKMRFAMPGGDVEFPLALQGNPDSLAYSWIPLGGEAAPDSVRPLAGARFTAPREPGFYRLALQQGGRRQTVSDLTLAVLVPFAEKEGASLEGYRIGTYLSERITGRFGRPQGFLRIDERTADLPLSKHFRVGDFLSHDQQRQWPRFAAVDQRLLDKLELVIAEIARTRGDPDSVAVRVNVNAGFRSPSYNRTVKRAAKDSRHQYGDAADVAIDANFDGRLTRDDSRLVARAVEEVEREHPDLVGGMGLYLSARYAHSYVHIDARGHRARWRG